MLFFSVFLLFCFGWMACKGLKKLEKAKWRHMVLTAVIRKPLTVRDKTFSYIASAVTLHFISAILHKKDCENVHSPFSFSAFHFRRVEVLNPVRENLFSVFSEIA